MSIVQTTPLLAHRVTDLVPCHVEVIASPESKKIGVQVDTFVPKIGSPRFFFGYERQHVEKFFIHRDRRNVVTIVSEDEAKKRGLVIIK
jgi:hypothetical protein